MQQPAHAYDQDWLVAAACSLLVSVMAGQTGTPMGVTQASMQHCTAYLQHEQVHRLHASCLAVAQQLRLEPQFQEQALLTLQQQLTLLSV